MRTTDLIWGARKGLFWGGLYAGLAVVLYAVDGGSQRFDRNGIAIGSLFVVYLLGGLSSGVILGAFRSALAKRVSATAVSILAAVPLAIGVIMLLRGPLTRWTTSEWLGVGLSSIVFGCIGMAVLWKDREWL